MTDEPRSAAAAFTLHDDRHAVVRRGDAEAVNRDLQSLHFRRAPLALTAEQAELTPFDPHRLALRKLAPLQRLRASAEARLIHTDGWNEALHRALA